MLFLLFTLCKNIQALKQGIMAKHSVCLRSWKLFFFMNTKSYFPANNLWIKRADSSGRCWWKTWLASYWFLLGDPLKQILPAIIEIAMQINLNISQPCSTVNSREIIKVFRMQIELRLSSVSYASRNHRKIYRWHLKWKFPSSVKKIHNVWSSLESI